MYNKQGNEGFWGLKRRKEFKIEFKKEKILI